MFSESALWENNTRKQNILRKQNNSLRIFWNTFFFKLKFLTEQWNPHLVSFSKFLQNVIFHWPIRNLALFQTRNIFKTIFLQKQFDDILNCSIHSVHIPNTVNNFKTKHQSWLVICQPVTSVCLFLFTHLFGGAKLSTIVMYMFTQCWEFSANQNRVKVWTKTSAINSVVILYRSKLSLHSPSELSVRFKEIRNFNTFAPDFASFNNFSSFKIFATIIIFAWFRLSFQSWNCGPE